MTKSAILTMTSAVALMLGHAAQACEIKIGATGPLSGAATQWGLAIKGAADFVAAEVNGKGGLKVGSESCNLTVVAIDAKYTAEGAAAAANNFVSQGVKFILGGSDGMFIAQSATARAKFLNGIG